MKILLSSDRSFLLNTGLNLLSIPKDELKIGYITTACKVSPDKDFVEKYKSALLEQNYNFTEFDIENKSEEEILNFFADKNVIHIEGGNTFYLLKIIRETGFDQILRKLLDRGLVYIGTSAGAYIMCPTIEVSTWRHNKKEEWWGLEDLSGLNYVPFLLKVHYTDDMRESVEEKIKNLNHPLRILRDGQGILVENNIYSFKGQGDEVQLA